MASFHALASAQARISAQLPSGTISPVSSALGMKSLGGMVPRVGWSQTTSASQPEI
jgi:hypothetical protein